LTTTIETQPSDEILAGIGRVAATVGVVRELGVEKVGATHCTGDAAIAEFADEYGDDFVPLGIGRMLTFQVVR
jgi:metal-dependent hydrolase (beta-lactamase superfamily II)